MTKPNILNQVQPDYFHEQPGEIGSAGAIATIATYLHGDPLTEDEIVASKEQTPQEREASRKRRIERSRYKMDRQFEREWSRAYAEANDQFKFF